MRTPSPTSTVRSCLLQELGTRVRSSPVPSVRGPKSDASILDSADLGRPSESMIDRRLRLASSSPDVKALFNNPPAYIYHVEEEEDLEPQPNYISGPSTDYWTPLPPIVSTPYHSPQFVSLTDNAQGSGVPSRTRHTDDAMKRGSDSLLESKLKDTLSKPRSLTNRAQSLDLTFSLSRITEAARQGSGLSRPDSPDISTGETGGSSPTSATVPSFPSVYGPPMTSRSVGGSNSHGSRSGMILDDDAVDEVSRVISNLGL